MTTTKKGRRGFTLIELSLVIALLAIMCVLAIPSISAINRSGDEFQQKESVNAIKSAYLLSRSQAITDGELQETDNMTVTILTSECSDAEMYIYKKMKEMLPTEFRSNTFRVTETRVNGVSTIDVLLL